MMLSKLIEFDYIFIKVMPYPDKIAKVNEWVGYFQWVGVTEIDKRIKIQEQSNKDPNKKITVIVVCLEKIPRLAMYCESLREEQKREIKDL